MKNIIELENPNITADLIDRMIKALERVKDAYVESHYSRRLEDSEYPAESVCDACTGCGQCTLTNGDVVDCFQVNTPDDSCCEFVAMDAEGLGNDIGEIVNDIDSIMEEISGYQDQESLTIFEAETSDDLPF